MACPPSAQAEFCLGTGCDRTDRSTHGGGLDADAGWELWRFEVESSLWRRIAVLPTPLMDAAMAVDDDRLVIFGGRGLKELLTDEHFVLRLDSGSWANPEVQLEARSNAAVTIRNGSVYVYGGDSRDGALDTVDDIVMLSGLRLRSGHAGGAAAAGSSVSVDDAGLLTIVPGHVEGASATAGAIVGSIIQLQTITQVDWTVRRPTCGGSSAAELGFPCQSPSAGWNSIPGVLACGGAAVYCSGDIVVTPSQWFLDDVSTFATSRTSVAISSRGTVRLYSALSDPTLSGNVNLADAVGALGVGDTFVVAGIAHRITSLSSTPSGSTLKLSSTSDTCGEVSQIVVVDNDVCVDTSVGVERFRASGITLTRGLMYADMPFGGSRGVDPASLPASQCRAGPPAYQRAWLETTHPHSL